MMYDIAARKGADRNTSALSERCWGRGSLAGFHRIRFALESHSGQMGFVIPIGWKYMARPMVKIIYTPNIRSSFCYKSTFLSFVAGFLWFLPSNVQIMLFNICYWWFFLSQGNRWTKYLVHPKICTSKSRLPMFVSVPSAEHWFDSGVKWSIHVSSILTYLHKNSFL